MRFLTTEVHLCRSAHGTMVHLPLSLPRSLDHSPLGWTVSASP
jgi:hypothetical protein